MEIWETIQQNIVEILIGLGAIGTYLSTRPKESKMNKLERKRQNAHKNSLKKEAELKKAYDKEAKLDKEVQNYASGKTQG